MNIIQNILNLLLDKSNRKWYNIGVDKMSAPILLRKGNGLMSREIGLVAASLLQMSMEFDFLITDLYTEDQSDFLIQEFSKFTDTYQSDNEMASELKACLSKYLDLFLEERGYTIVRD